MSYFYDVINFKIMIFQTKYINKIIFLSLVIIFILFIFSQSAIAGASGKIFNKKEYNKTVDFGLCHESDSLIEYFYIQNTGDVTLMIGSSDSFTSPYTYSVWQLPGHDGQNSEFEKTELTYLYILPNRTDSIKKLYTPKETSIGKFKKALIRMGIYDSSINGAQVNDFCYFLEDTVIARKTKKYIDGYDDILDFDSVYCQNEMPSFKLAWKVRNVWKTNLQTTGQKLQEYTYPTVFSVSGVKTPPFVFPSKLKNDYEWEIAYSPVNETGLDSAEFRLFFEPTVGTTDSATVILRGVRVQQNMQLVSATVPIVSGDGKDTFDIGDIRVGTKKTITGIIKNRSFLPFGCDSQKVYHENFDIVDASFQLSQPFLSGGRHLQKDSTDTFEIKFKPEVKGKFLNRYVIYSDLKKRGIKSVPPSAERITFYIRGTALQPLLSLPSKTLSFGNVYVNEKAGCYSNSEAMVFLANSGNEKLVVKSVDIEPSQNFSIEANIKKGFELNAGSSSSFSCTFSPTDAAQYFASMKFATNAVAPNDTVTLFLTAVSLPPRLTKLQIPKNIRVKPGNVIFVPIIVKDGNAQFARTFDDTLTFDNSILKFVDRYTVGTASEASFADAILLDNEGKLAISIRMQTNAYLARRDTLILLKFQTYIGKRLNSQLSFSNPRFGDGRCPEVLDLPDDLTESDGLVTLDSVCGLQFIVFPDSSQKFALFDPMPNPATESFELSYSLTFETDFKISLYDSYGNYVETIDGGRKNKGTYFKSHTTNHLAPGIYFCEMRSGIFHQIKVLAVVK
ncbi:MAG: type sorting protein [Ignavibacteria bacterium]|nr:type sorting protein [Ignavibacteria bacterium]